VLSHLLLITEGNGNGNFRVTEGCKKGMGGPARPPIGGSKWDKAMVYAIATFTISIDFQTATSAYGIISSTTWTPCLSSAVPGDIF
jgi:hypothetical protein